MLGIGFGEILIISTIGLIVIGPKRLPETARFLGHLFGRLQRQVNSVKSDIRREMAMEDMKKIQREYEDTTRDMRNAFDQAADGISPPSAWPGADSSRDRAEAEAAESAEPPEAKSEETEKDEKEKTAAAGIKPPPPAAAP